MSNQPGSEGRVPVRKLPVSDKTPDTQSTTAVGGISSDGLTTHVAAARDRIFEGLNGLKAIMDRRGTSLMQRKFTETQVLLAGLDERTRRNDLPDSYVRMQLNDARLDALTLLSGLKVALLYEHQRLLAPTEKLRSEIEASIERFLGEEPAPLTRDVLNAQEELTRLQQDFERLAQCEKLILGHESGF